ncbi:MAG TPA: efflux RND transporter periplasmic adaptor subunit [Parvularculaceae bacterium]|nr:efflux RND transporter periplasmic adaptor subunit [Parvularculaceae bacterium]
MRKLSIKRPGRYAAGAALLLALAGGGAFFAGTFDQKAKAAADAGPPAPPPANVRVAEAVATQLAPHSQAPGSVVSVNDSLIAAATPGKILWVSEIGSEVKEGDVIARIDPADAILQRDESRADIKRLAARADYLSRLVERHEGLGEDGGESEAAIDQMRADRDEALQNLERARVALRRAETALERTEVKAPFNGRLAAREIEVGEFANPGAPIARLVNIDELEVTARAPDAMLVAVHAGDDIAVSNGLETLQAKVRAVVPVGDTISRTLELRLVLPATDWHIGSAVQVSLPRSAPKRVVAVHRDALVLRADRITVFKIAEEDTARQIEVELGAADGDLIEVIGDIKPGERVVTRGGERLRDGQKVVIQDAAGGAMS